MAAFPESSTLCVLGDFRDNFTWHLYDSTDSNVVLIGPHTTNAAATTSFSLMSDIHFFYPKFWVDGVGYHDEKAARIAMNESYARASWFVPRKECVFIPPRIRRPVPRPRNGISVMQRRSEKRKSYKRRFK